LKDSGEKTISTRGSSPGYRTGQKLREEGFRKLKIMRRREWETGI